MTDVEDAPGPGPGAFRGPTSAVRERLAAARRPQNLRDAEPIHLYVAAITALGVALTVWLVLTDRFHLNVVAPGIFWPGGLRRIMFSVFVVLGELFSLTVPRGNDSEEVTTSPTFAFGLLIGWGVGWALTSLVAAAIIADLVRRKPFRKLVFNAGQYAVSIGCAGLVYSGLGGGPSVQMADLSPMFVAAATFFFVNYTLMSVAIGLASGTPIADYFRKNFFFNLATTGVLLSMAPVVVVLAENSPILVPLLTLPLAAVYTAASASLKNSRLEELNQLKDDFVAMVSHELRTPLTSIQGSVKTLIQLGRDLDEEQRLSFLEAVDRQSDRLRRLIERLLVVARLEADAEHVSFAPVPLRTLCEYVVFELRPSAGAHSFQFDFDPELVEVETDEGKVHQILSNLAENALKYSRTDSRITLRCRAESDAVLLMVEDQGPGIPDEAQAHIFDRFYQVDQSKTRHVGGTGLGLYICQKLAEAIGATLELDAEYQDGSRFVLRIPRKSHKAAAMPQGDMAVNQAPAFEAILGAGNGRASGSGNGNGHAPDGADGVEGVETAPTPLRKVEEVTRGRVVAFLTTLHEV